MHCLEVQIQHFVIWLCLRWRVMAFGYPSQGTGMALWRLSQRLELDGRPLGRVHLQQGRLHEVGNPWLRNIPLWHLGMNKADILRSLYTIDEYTSRIVYHVQDVPRRAA